MKNSQHERSEKEYILNHSMKNKERKNVGSKNMLLSAQTIEKTRSNIQARLTGRSLPHFIANGQGYLDGGKGGD